MFTFLNRLKFMFNQGNQGWGSNYFFFSDVTKYRVRHK